MRDERVFLEQVEEELRTTAVQLGHDRYESGKHRLPCRRCDLESLADEAADRHAAMVADRIGAHR